MKNKSLTLLISGLLTVGIAGAAIAIILSLSGVDTQPDLAVGSVYIAAVGMMFIVLIVEIVSAIKIEDSTFHTALLAASLIVLYLFSTDMQLFFAEFGIDIPKAVFGTASEIAFVLTSVLCCWYIVFLYNLSVNRKAIASTSVPILATLLITDGLTIDLGYGYIAHFIIAAFISATFCIILWRAKRKQNIGITTYFVVAMFILSVGVQNVNALFYSGCTAVVPGISLAYAVMTVTMFLCVYMLFSIRADSKAVKSGEYKHQAELFEKKALSGQIKPHFIFNSLEAVRTLYHRDIAQGDAAVNHLSDFLRGSIKSFDSELIPFETEINNVFSYTEFENLKRQNKIDVIYNIDFTEFSVPPFSVQTFVENSLKHSGVDGIENGIIVISSYKSGENAVVEIYDNGKGFDPSKISENSHGIKNARGRFALTLGCEPEIESAAGSGTRIIITIGLNKQGELKK